MHTGDCWKKAHSNDPKIRKELKRKRVQPEILHSGTGITKRVRKTRRRRSLFPRAEEGADNDGEGEEGEEGEDEDE
jgi:hypothetical protein